MSKKDFFSGLKGLVEEMKTQIDKKDNDIQILGEALIVIRNKAQKFVDKVEDGRARSVETYQDMKYVVSLVDNLVSQIKSGESIVDHE